MSSVSSERNSDHRQKRATPVRARSQASKEAIVQAAMALWRTKGFAGTTVTDICKAAGVSKALFYVYFSRREDVLLEVEVFTVRDAHQAAADVAAEPYELRDVIAAVVDSLEQRFRRYPPELVFETVLETYRLEQRVLVEGATAADLAFLFLEPFRRAQRDGVFPGDVDVVRAARIAQALVADCVRYWAAGGFGDGPLPESLAGEIDTMVRAIR